MAQDTDTGPVPLGDYRPHRKKYFQFDPTFNTGHALQILVLVLGGAGLWSSWQADRATQRMEIEQIKRDAAAEVTRSEKSITELKGDVKRMEGSVNQMNVSVERLATMLQMKESQK